MRILGFCSFVLLLLFTTLTTAVKFISPNGVYQAEWTFDEGYKVVTFEIKLYTEGYIGLGISETGNGDMSKSDFIVGHIDASTGSVSVTDRYTNPRESNSEPSLDTSLGGTNDLFNVSGSRSVNSSNTVITIRFSRLTNTTDKYDTVLSDRVINFLWAYGSVESGTKLEEHTFYGGVPMNFITGKMSSTLINAHAVLMLIAWSVIIAPMAILARFFKFSIPTWFKFHSWLNITALVAFLIGVILIFVEKKAIGGNFHSYLGIGILVFGLLQGILGKVSDKMWYKGKAPSFWPDKLHWFLGYLLIILAFVNTFLGINLYHAQASSYAVYGAYTGFFVLLTIFLQIRVGQQVIFFSKNMSTKIKMRQLKWAVRMVKPPPLSQMCLGIRPLLH